MERLQHLLELLVREEDVKYEEEVNVLQEYKLAAVRCERRCREKKKNEHKKLLQRVKSIEVELQRRNKHEEQIDPNGASKKLQDGKDADARNALVNSEVVDRNFNYINGSENASDSKKGSELIENFSKLECLKRQEKMLEGWYGSMSEQLQEEQKKLTDRFNEMRVQILQQKMYYLKTSQEYIHNLSSESPKSESGIDHSSRSKMVRDHKVERKHSPLQDSAVREKGLLKSAARGLFEPKSESSDLSFKGANSIEHDKEKINLDGKEHERKWHGNQEEAGTKVGGQSKQSMVWVENDGAGQGNLSHLIGSNSSDLFDRTLGISPIHRNLDVGSRKRGESVRSQLAQRYGETAKERMPGQGSSALEYANISSSTPISKGGLVERDGDEHQGLLKEKSHGSQLHDKVTVSKRSCELLEAAAQGYLTRKLIKTDKVQELIKTIKDTRAVLGDMDKESVVVKKLHESKVDLLLRATIEQELHNAKNRFYSIFTTYSPAEKLEVIERSRMAAVDRESKQYLKEKGLSSNQGKRLSKVTRKTLRRRQESSSHDRSMSRPHTSPAGRNSPDGRKHRKSWDIRSVKPIPSNGSPFHYLQNRQVERKPDQEDMLSEISEASSQPKEYKGGVKKTLKKRTIAATLNRKATSLTG